MCAPDAILVTVKVTDMEHRDEHVHLVNICILYYNIIYVYYIIKDSFIKIIWNNEKQ